MNQPFGSRIVTSSGILLNSQILDFSWPNKSHSSGPHNPVQSVYSFIITVRRFWVPSQNEAVWVLSLFSLFFVWVSSGSSHFLPQSKDMSPGRLERLNCPVEKLLLKENSINAPCCL